MNVEVMSLDSFDLPILASAEVGKYALFIRYCCEKIYAKFAEDGAPPQFLLPWLKEYRHALNDVHSMTESAVNNDTKSQSVQVLINVYNTIRDELTPSARRELAVVTQKKRLDAKDAEVAE